MARLRFNGLATGAAGSVSTLTLGASLTSSATSVTFGAALTYGNGTAVPTIGAGDYIPLAILDSNGHVSEIVFLTAYTAAATTGTIARGKEGTTGVAHSSGDKIAHGPLVEDMLPTRPLDSTPPTDTFDGTALGGGWSLAGSYVSGDFSIANGMLTVAAARAAGSYVYMSPPGGWTQITMKCWAVCPASTAFGILAVDSTGAGVGAGATWNGAPDATLIGTVAAGAFTTGSANTTSVKGSTASQGIPHWVRVRKSGTSYFVSASLNGASWGVETSALTNASTITRVGFGAWLGTPTAFGVDWFNVA